MPIKSSDAITGSMNHHRERVWSWGGGGGGGGADISSYNGTRKKNRI